jgi:hypothetical protein
MRGSTDGTKERPDRGIEALGCLHVHDVTDAIEDDERMVTDERTT